MSTIEVILDARELLSGLEIPDWIEASLMDVMTAGVDSIAEYAQENHRFDSQTGNLISAIKSEMYGLSGRVYIDDYIADYGKYVHDGFKTWAPDTFVYDAKYALEDQLIESLNEEYDRLMSKA
jgi:hypothetical protein